VTIVGLQINPAYLLSVLLVWLVIYHFVYWLTALARDPSLVCWSVGPLGLRVVPLREPSAGQRLLQLFLAGAVLAAVAYTTLFALKPPPIVGLEPTLEGRAIAVLIPVAAFTIYRLAAIFREHRFPLWGEAGVMASVQRSLATGAVVFFTPAGRAFLRDRFGATPTEFRRMVRY